MRRKSYGHQNALGNSLQILAKIAWIATGLSLNVVHNRIYGKCFGVASGEARRNSAEVHIAASLNQVPSN